MKARPNFGWKLWLAIRLNAWLVRLRIMPTADAVSRWPAAKRKALKPASWMTYAPPASVQMKREAIATADGPLELKWFRKDALQAPTILFIHGGGWVMGGVDSLDYLCANLCDRLDVGVVAVDYRLAPDHRFPAALEDCYAALAWMAARARGPVAVVGDSAGGNLAGAVCLLARERGGPAIAHQTLIYPSLDATLESPSMAILQPGMDRAELQRRCSTTSAITTVATPRVTDPCRGPPRPAARAHRYGGLGSAARRRRSLRGMPPGCRGRGPIRELSRHATRIPVRAQAMQRRPRCP